MDLRRQEEEEHITVEADSVLAVASLFNRTAQKATD